jgi:hypothetical protein
MLGRRPARMTIRRWMIPTTTPDKAKKKKAPSIHRPLWKTLLMTVSTW